MAFDTSLPIWAGMREAERSIRIWLMTMIVLVAAMIVLGGATRLTNSGLSITEWLPVRGALPPMSEGAWQVEFAKYQQIDEFRLEHPDMTLSGFKFIYFWEWAHRLLGRVIGLAFVLPLVWFALKKRLPKGFGLPLLGIGILIGLQGVIGWWMVHSGLQDGMVAVSQYRLATHLGMAFLVLGSLVWMWKAAGPAGEPVARSGLTKLTGGLVFAQIVAGAFVAGTHSGKTYNSWPMMDGDIVPSGYSQMEPFWLNWFENPAAIQFNHRALAYVILALGIYIFVRAPKGTAYRKTAGIFKGLLLWQVVLGIWTLLAVAPLWLSLLHQFSAVLLFLATMLLMWEGRAKKALNEYGIDIPLGQAAE